MQATWPEPRVTLDDVWTGSGAGRLLPEAVMYIVLCTLIIIIILILLLT